jgi:O-antigen/teichoic acid export membrane protein
MNLSKTRRDLLTAFISQLGFKLLGFAVLALMARQLSQADYGKLMFALTLCGVTVLVTDLGASTDLSRRVAAAPAGARRRLEAVLSARLPLLAAYLVLLPAWTALTKPDALAVVAAIAVFGVCRDVYRSYSSLFLGLHRVGDTIIAFGSSLIVLVAPDEACVQRIRLVVRSLGGRAGAFRCRHAHARLHAAL